VEETEAIDNYADSAPVSTSVNGSDVAWKKGELAVGGDLEIFSEALWQRE
jgi:hypothetical protein